MDVLKAHLESELAAIREAGVSGLAHITGGGISENLPRVLPASLDAEIDLTLWHVPPVFAWLAREAGLPQAEMLRTFNCGVGLIAVADHAKASDVIAAFAKYNQMARKIGVLIAGEGDPSVRFAGALTL